MPLPAGVGRPFRNTGHGTEPVVMHAGGLGASAFFHTSLHPFHLTVVAASGGRARRARLPGGPSRHALGTVLWTA